MPLGWYLAQGLIPLGPSSSDDEEGPCQLPNGRIVCSPHGLVTCHRCCSDYTVMEDVLSEEEGEEDDDKDDEDRDAHSARNHLQQQQQLPPWLPPWGGLAYRPPGTFQDAQPEETEAEAIYWNLSPETRAIIYRVYGPPPPRQTSDSQAQATLNRLRQNMPPHPFPEKVRGTGHIFPTKFFPLNTTIKPMELFPATMEDEGGILRYTHFNDRGKLLVLTDGACLNNGQPNPKAGWSVQSGQRSTGVQACLAGRLETTGPFGDESAQTSNRAELRAVIVALRSGHWRRLHCHAIVIATDSGYVVEGATKHIKSWIRYGWTTRQGTGVKNKDLWELLLGDVERWDREGVKVHFWKIPREWNSVADYSAKTAAAGERVSAEWRDPEV
ncbi:hypothetical protein PFICI_00130 [Pestalotiopsis fici W106-1]|uniref:ribonuclease H n=1 Tax=Pestalotiopsis fici (strain W106-1 / CGMCC3.15140) TaxID=1229662 RepID=W3XLH2_PESFW|nr:uncharacterized protein PFICI_00130 [Pestalotiopsis fici W106-1]ETS86302.1 hypothetical protein PFICI_00130 [Pestalotiopsis fici W106-1]